MFYNQWNQYQMSFVDTKLKKLNNFNKSEEKKINFIYRHDLYISCYCNYNSTTVAYNKYFSYTYVNKRFVKSCVQ